MRQRTLGRRLGCLALGLALCLLAVRVAAIDAESAAASNPELEARVQRVAEELRCLVCQNQTIADSNAELARDLRREVRQMLARGASEREVREFMVDRYGDFVLYRPPFKATTLALWIGPFVLLLAGFLIHRRTVAARRNAMPVAAGLSAEDEVRLRALVGAEDEVQRRALVGAEDEVRQRALAGAEDDARPRASVGAQRESERS